MKKKTTTIRFDPDMYAEALERSEELNFKSFSAFLEAVILCFLSGRHIITTTYVSGKPIYKAIPETEDPDVVAFDKWLRRPRPDQETGKLLSNASQADLRKRLNELADKEWEKTCHAYGPAVVNPEEGSK